MDIIQIKNVSKRFIISHEKDALIRSILPSAFRLKYREEFWALKDISFNLKEGDSVAIVGPNGAGKSTLLNIIAGISSPTIGKVRVNGKISAILTLGAGFHPELTGEENLFLNASILGMSIKEIRSKYRDIIAFSELGNFIDAPIQTYSAGMLLRLGFSIAIHVDFDILLIDEILSVGDMYFQNKCIERIKHIKDSKKTLIISSQSLDLVNALTERAVLLNRGKLVESGTSNFIIKSYEVLSRRDSSKELKSELQEIIQHRKSIEDIKRLKPSVGKRVGSKEAEITEVTLCNFKDERKEVFTTGEGLKVKARFKCQKEILDPHFGVAIFNANYVYCYGPNTEFDDIKIARLNKGEGEFTLLYPKLILLPGLYYLSCAIWDKEEEVPYDYHCCCYRLEIRGKARGFLYREQYLSGRDRKIMKGEPINLKNIYGEEKDIYFTNDAMIIEANIDNYSSMHSDNINLSVFREDGIGCFRIESRVRGRKGGLFKVDIMNLHLLPGHYFLTVNGEIYKKYFSVYSEKKDHGIVYMPHEWNLRLP